MAQEYMSTSKVAIKDVAEKLAFSGDGKEKKEDLADAEMENKSNNKSSLKLDGSSQMQGYNFPAAAKVFIISGGTFTGNFH